MDDHISEENMTLKGISENILYMNASYVSRIFVKEVGQTFSSYVTEHRIERQKKFCPEQVWNKSKMLPHWSAAEITPTISAKYSRKLQE